MVCWSQIMSSICLLIVGKAAIKEFTYALQVKYYKPCYSFAQWILTKDLEKSLITTNPPFTECPVLGTCKGWLWVPFLEIETSISNCLLSNCIFTFGPFNFFALLILQSCSVYGKPLFTNDANVWTICMKASVGNYCGHCCNDPYTHVTMTVLQTAVQWH